MEFLNTYRNKGLFFANFILQLSYHSFIFHGCFKSIFGAEVDVPTKFKLIYGIIRYFIIFPTQYNIFKHWKTLATLVDNLKAASVDGETLGHAKCMPTNGSAIRLINVCKFMCCALGIASGINALKKPETPEFLTSLFPNPKSLPAAIKIPIALFHAYTSLYAAYMLMIMIVTVYLYTVYVVSAMRELRYRINARPNNVDWEAVTRQYSNITLLVTFSNGVFARWIFGVEVALMCILIINVFLAVVHGAVRSTIAAFCGLSLTKFLFNILSEVLEESLALIQDWKRIPRKPRWVHKFLAASRPVKMKLVQFGFVDKSLILTFMDIIANQSANLVLTYRYD